MEPSRVAVVVLAAGLGTRFRSGRAKVLHRIAGRSLLGHVLAAVRPLGCGRIVVVVGHQGDEVAAEARAVAGDVTIAVQPEPDGTAGAVAAALPVLAEDTTHLVVVPGDVPLLRPETLAVLLEADPDAEVVLGTTTLEDPTGYGRVLRRDGRVVGIVEEADADPDQRAVREVNTGLYRFAREAIARVLPHIATDNVQGERYLTDVVGLLAAEGARIATVALPGEDTVGVNDRVQLARAGRVLWRRVAERLALNGVTIVDPDHTYIDPEVEIGPDTTILPGCLIEGRTRIGSGAQIGPHTRLCDAEVADGAAVTYAVVVKASVGPGASVGPFAYLRPGTRLAAGAKAGTFVEIKASTVGERSKVPHLAYIGDATIGRDVNVGAGTITCNYDGVHKHRTVIGDGAFIGSDTMLVAPVEVGPGAYTGAGSTITRDVPADALAVERAEQRTIPGWAARRRSDREQAR